MKRRLATALAILLLLAGCSWPVPPGARVELLHPPTGSVTGPEVMLLIRAVAWGPGMAGDWGDPVGGDLPVSSVAIHPLAVALEVDGKPYRELHGANLYRIRLRLAPGRHRIRIHGAGRAAETTVEVRDPPPLAFVPAPPEEPLPAGLEDRLRKALAGPGDVLRLTRDGDHLLVAVLHGRHWRLWRLPLAAEAPPAAPALLEVEPNPTIPFPIPQESLAIAACGNGFAVAAWPAGEDVLQIWRISRRGDLRQQARLPLASLAAAFVHRQGAFDAPTLLASLRCAGDYTLLGLTDRVHLRIGANGQWRVTDDAGPLLPLPDGRWLLLDPARGILRDADKGQAVALPLPPHERQWRLQEPSPPGRIFNRRPQWSLAPGQPPRVQFTSLYPEDDGVFTLIAN